MKPPNRKLRHESICLLTLACGLIFSVEVSAADFSSRDYPVGHMPTRVFVHDFNKDGKLDLAVLNVGDGTVNDGTVSILLGNGNGTFQTAHTFSSGGVNPTSIGFRRTLIFVKRKGSVYFSVTAMERFRQKNKSLAVLWM